METTISVALVGLGGHGRRIQEAVALLPDFHVAAVYDPVAAEAEAAADRFGCEAASSFEDVLNREQVDAVLLATPNHLHRSQTEAALAAGLDVFVEKPIANTVADGRAMVQAAEKADRILMVGHNIRYGRATRLAKKLLNEGRLGEVVSTEIHYSADNVQKGTHAGWRFEPGGCPLLPMMQLGIHAVDLVHYLLGPVRSVTAHARSVLTKPGIVDAVTGSFVLANGVGGTVVSTYCTPVRFEVRIAGTEGLLVHDWIPHRLTFQPRGAAPVEKYDFSGPDLEDMLLELTAFAEAVRTRTPPETDGYAGLRALAVVEAMRQSAESGKVVEVVAV